VRAVRALQALHVLTMQSIAAAFHAVRGGSDHADPRRIERTQREGLSPAPRPVDLYGEAVRLNEVGSRDRRDGAHAEAVELHCRALEILRRLDDRHTVALTQNNLALALSLLRDETSAIALLEEAAMTLRRRRARPGKLGDRAS
jgi:Tetratricopeptide repeat